MAGRERRGCGCLRIKRSYYASGSASPAPCKIEICTGIEAKAVDPLHQMTLAKRSRMGHSLPRARRDTVRFSHEYAPTNIPPKHTRAHSNGDTKPTCIDTPPLPAPTPPPLTPVHFANTKTSRLGHFVSFQCDLSLLGHRESVRCTARMAGPPRSYRAWTLPCQELRARHDRRPFMSGRATNRRE